MSLTSPENQSAQVSYPIRLLLVSAIFGALTFVAAFVGGIAITSTFGPGTSGVITVLLTTVIVVSGGLSLPRFGTLLGINLVFSALAIPTPLFGPVGPGKLLIGVVTGLLYEIPVLVLRRRPKIAFAIAAGAAASASVFLIYFLTGLGGGTRSETLERFLVVFAIVYGVLGAIGGTLGVVIFNRYLANTPIVRYLRRSRAM